MRNDRRPGFTRAANEVHYARRQLRLEQQLRELQCGARRCLGWLQHPGVSHRECRRDFPREHEQREIPGYHLTDDSQRYNGDSRYCVLELVGPPSVIEKVRSRHWHVEIARFLDRFAAIHRLGYCKLARPILNQPGNPVEVLSSLSSSEFAPWSE